MVNPTDIWAIAPNTLKQFLVDVATRTDGPSAVALADERPFPMRVTDQGVAVVDIDGVMVKRAGRYAGMYGIAGNDQVRTAVEAAARDDAVRGILLRAYSPGGSVEGLGELADTVFEARQKKPVVGQIDGLAASAAYYVLSQADAVWANHGADLVGSIGSIMYTYDVSKMFAEMGAEAVVIATGTHKGAGVWGSEITDEQRAEWQRLVDFYGDEFVGAVRRGRSMPVDDVRALADGRVWPAREAISMGLIDGIRPVEKTLAQFARAANVRKSRARAQVMGMGLEKIS